MRILAALVLALPATALAQEPPEIEALHAFTQAQAKAGMFAGAVLVAQGKAIAFDRVYGSRNEVTGEAMQSGDRFNIASVGKLFTAVAILQLIDRGKLTLDTPIGAVLPAYSNAAARQQVTVRHLLTHTDGLGGIDELFGAQNASIRSSLTGHTAMMALHEDRAPAFTPGSKVEYDNFGMVVLGRMIEVLSGKDYYTYIGDNIFAPAGMLRTDFAACANPAADMAQGFATVAGKRVSNCLTQPERGFAAGGAYSTTRDLLLFVHALNAGTLVSKKRLAEATRTQKEYMGLGFFATGYGKGVPPRDFRWGHGGSSDGACTDLRFYPRTRETVIVLSNREAPGCFTIANFLHDLTNAKQGK
ncbi:serine hydrolase [Novosphingobium sp.]|uniref:serine hydrolase domain-containing protein n=1 Tax=Novosphingobium sp. TaxID=1874826 RepID=UPI0025D27BE0|nr:serine hydrolase domain-containing protein [Novosphingobium sp.]